jgi:hypothetical protein
MHRVHVPGGTFTTGDRIAHAILRYAAVLANRGLSDHVVIPTCTEFGVIGSLRLKLGPLSEHLKVKAVDDNPFLNDHEAVEDLHQRRRAVVASHSLISVGATELSFH